MNYDIELLVQARLAGMSYPEIAAMMNCSVKTVQRRLKTEQVQLRLREEGARRGALEAEIWTTARARAIGVINELLEHEDPRVKLQAAKTVLRAGDDREEAMQLAGDFGQMRQFMLQMKAERDADREAARTSPRRAGRE